MLLLALLLVVGSALAETETAVVVEVLLVVLEKMVNKS